MAPVAIFNPLVQIIERARATDAHGVLLIPPRPRLIFLTSAQLAGRKPRIITPERRLEALSRYQLDYEAISNHWDPIGLTEDLVAATGDPGWNQRREPDAKVVADDSCWEETETCSLYVTSKRWRGHATFYHLKGIQCDFYLEQVGFGACQGKHTSVDHFRGWLVCLES